MTAFEDIARGKRAAALLEDPLFREACGQIEKALTASWRASGAAEAGRREELWRELAALDRVESYLREVVQTGRFARGPSGGVVGGNGQGQDRK
jgi:hypothetical protein